MTLLPDVGGGDDTIAGQLPDVKFVNGQDTIHLTEQFTLDVVQLDVSWNCLKKDQSRFLHYIIK